MKKYKKRQANLCNGYTPKKWELINQSPETLSRGQRLRRERYLRGLTIDMAAAMLNITPSYLGALERGSRTFSHAVVEKVHQVFHLSYDFILLGTNLSSSALNDFVRENASFDARHNADILLSVCDKKDAEVCYQMIRHFLASKNHLLAEKEEQEY